MLWQLVSKILQNTKKVVQERILPVFHQALFSSVFHLTLPHHYQYVLKELKNKTYGKLLKMEGSFGFFREFNDNSRVFKKSLGGGSLLDIGIYPIFAALF